MLLLLIACGGQDSSEAQPSVPAAPPPPSVPLVAPSDTRVAQRPVGPFPETPVVQTNKVCAFTATDGSGTFNVAAGARFYVSRDFHYGPGGSSGSFDFQCASGEGRVDPMAPSPQESGWFLYCYAGE